MSKVNRSDWLTAGLQCLARHGIGGVRVEPLAKELGVTKGSFYWHFSDRKELLDAMLAEWAERETEDVIAQAEAAGSDPQARLERLVRIATEGFDAEVELALRSWARLDASVSRIVDKVDRRRLDYLKQLLRGSGFSGAETEARAFLLYSALFGDALLSHSHGRFSRKRVLRDAVDLLVAR